MKKWAWQWTLLSFCTTAWILFRRKRLCFNDLTPNPVFYLLKFKWSNMLTLKGNRNRHNSKNWAWQSIFFLCLCKDLKVIWEKIIFYECFQFQSNVFAGNSPIFDIFHWKGNRNHHSSWKSVCQPIFFDVLRLKCEWFLGRNSFFSDFVLIWMFWLLKL